MLSTVWDCVPKVDSVVPLSNPSLGVARISDGVEFVKFDDDTNSILPFFATAEIISIAPVITNRQRVADLPF
jgi:hypothetical protein